MKGMERQAQRLIVLLAEKHGQALDSPVVEYLAR